MSENNDDRITSHTIASLYLTYMNILYEVVFVCLGGAGVGGEVQ